MVKTYAVHLNGLTPLLMHWDNIEWADLMDEWRKDPNNKKLSKAGDDRTPAWRWVGSVYHDGELVCIPQDNISASLLGGGAMLPTGKGQKTFKSDTQSGMKIDELFVPLLLNGAVIRIADIHALQSENSFKDHIQYVRQLGFSLMIKRAAVGNAKHIRVRPQFNLWALKFHVTVWDEGITRDILTQLLTLAGSYKGLGDWRPGSPKKPGPWGRFEVVSVTEA